MMVYFAVMVAFILILAQWMNTARAPGLRRFAWGISGGTVTGFQNFIKDSLTLIKAIQSSDSQEGFPWFGFVLIGLALGTAFGGLLLLTACMKRYDATYSSTMFVGSFVLSTSIMSAIHYDTFGHLQTLANMILYPIGLTILMIGVAILLKEGSKDTVTRTILATEEASSMSHHSNEDSDGSAARGSAIAGEEVVSSTRY